MADERHMPAPNPADPAQTEALLTRTLETYASRVAPPADALTRMQARLDAVTPARRPRAGAVRWAIAGAVALLVLLLVSPVGRATAATVGHAARTAIVTVRDAVTGGSGGTATPAVGTSASGTTVPGSATAATGSATAPAGTVTGTVAGTSTATRGTSTPRTGTTPTPSPTSTPAATSVPASVPAALLRTPTPPTGTAPVGSPAGTATAP